MRAQKTQLVQLRRMYLRALGKSLSRRRSALQHINVRRCSSFASMCGPHVLLMPFTSGVSIQAERFHMVRARGAGCVQERSLA